MTDDHWRKVSEEMPKPEADDEFLVGYAGETWIYKAYVDKKGKFRDCADYELLPNVTHWRPLPAPPEEDRMQRYDPFNDWREGVPWPEMQPIENGDWVRFDDAEAALAQRDARIAELEAMNTSRLEDVAVLLKAFDDGLFVRDTKGDGDPRWAIKLLTPLAAMARLQRTVDAALAAAKGE